MRHQTPVFFFLNVEMKTFVPELFVLTLADSRKRTYSLSYFQRLYITMDDALSCKAAMAYSIFMAVIIVLGLFSLLFESVPTFQYKPSSCAKPACDNDPTYCPNGVICAPIPYPEFTNIDLACVIIFTIDLVIRSMIVCFMPSR